MTSSTVIFLAVPEPQQTLTWWQGFVQAAAAHRPGRFLISVIASLANRPFMAPVCIDCRQRKRGEHRLQLSSRLAVHTMQYRLYRVSIALSVPHMPTVCRLRDVCEGRNSIN
jgi:hypothetical protein